MRVETLIDRLTPELRERVRLQGAPEGPAAAADGDFVLYWMRASLRGHENPALDAALAFAEQLGSPVFVYQGLSERYPFASDRHHTFILEGVIDVRRELDERGVGYALHLERPGHRVPALLELAGRASLVVTEEMPVAPLASWTRALAERISPVPVIAVDAACVVPMRVAAGRCKERRFERAFEYRRATSDLRRDRVRRVWADRTAPTPAFCPELPFEPVDVSLGGIPELVAECEIDHSVGPVAHTRGGATAGYRRWRGFLEHGLSGYATRRNDPLANGVSRLSPYLHYGMVSPFRIAREAAGRLEAGKERGRGFKGPEKYLDELLVWRELAWTYCYQEPRHAEVDALPAWARGTLDEHREDPRPRLLSWEQLARARSGDALWDAAQLSLLRHGELHNNVRMTWGKALLHWTGGPERALDLLEDLNHRYALDGRDPSSYGGILWCLGQFDRPFTPERPVLGAVRPRPTEQHARRLDVEAYRRRVEASPFASPPKVLVIGGGVAGLSCARALRDAGLAVTVLDKGRGPGGRASTRRGEVDGRPVSFDHGAQYFTVRDPELRRRVESWRQQGVVAPWRGRVVRWEESALQEREGERWVGTPGMSALVRHLASDVDVTFGARVTRLEGSVGRWRARLADGSTPGSCFDVVVLALPAPQALELWPAELADEGSLGERVAAVEMAPCWATMAVFPQRLETEWDAAEVPKGGVLSWVARDTSKPERVEPESWVLHASPEWSRQHLEEEPEGVASAALDELASLLDSRLPRTLSQSAHRWRFARVERPLGERCLYDPQAGIGLCGDWCLGARIEAAWLSGAALAGRVLGHEVARVRSGERADRAPGAESTAGDRQSELF